MHAVIIGAGLGGLICGRILSRQGFDITILERPIELHPLVNLTGD